MKNWGAEQFSSDVYGRNIWGSPTNSNADFAWLQHMVASMDKKTGRVAVVLPQGVLFRSGKEGEIRRQLILSDKLDCVITLVNNLFYGAGVSACILLLNNAKPESHKGKVCLIDASGIFTAQRAKNVLSDADVDAIFELYAGYDDVIERAKVVSTDDLAAKDYTLQVNSYIEKRVVQGVSPLEVKRDFYAALEAVEVAEARLYDLLVKGGYIHE